jgi:lipoprotein NlpD
VIHETRNWRSVVACVVAACMLAACASRPRAPAPVEDRSTGARTVVPAAPVASSEAVKAAPGAENAGKPGYYTVRRGDTLLHIALDAVQNWRDVARWNNLDNPNALEVGQVLRVAPPATEVARAPAPATPASRAPSAPVPAAPASGTPSSVPPSDGSPAVPPQDEIAWGWPTVGPGMILAGFDEQRNKGLDIGGKAGDPVLAAADGRVVYAGAGLRGYGNLIILKHNNTYLSAYAHNQVLLVKEDQAVRKGQKIAEMGSTDADRVKLHFEIRRQGKPVDPTRYLPMR